MTIGSRLAFTAWRLYRTNALARRVLTPRLRASGSKGLARHEAFVDGALPSDAASRPRPSEPAALDVAVAKDSTLGRRLLALLNHWGARYQVRDARGEGMAVLGAPGSELALCGPNTVSLVPVLPRGARVPGEPEWTTLEAARERRLPCTARVFGESPIAGVQVMAGDLRGLALDERVLLPRFTASPWGSVLPDAIDRVLGRADWRAPLPALISARVDDVTGAAGLGWLTALEERGIHPSIGTLHDEWLAAGKAPVEALVAASRRGCSVSPHAFSMERFIWYDAPRGCPFSSEDMARHREKLERDARATGLVYGKTLNAHFDVIGGTAVDAAHALGFRYALGEHALDQDWREGARARDPLGTPLYAYGPLDPAGKLFGFQAAGAIASSAAPRSRYDWLRNFLELDPETGKPVGASLDHEGAVRQGVTQLLSALHAGFPAYLLAHEIHLDALGRERVGELVDAILGEVTARVSGSRTSGFDDLPGAAARGGA